MFSLFLMSNLSSQKACYAPNRCADFDADDQVDNFGGQTKAMRGFKSYNIQVNFNLDYNPKRFINQYKLVLGCRVQEHGPSCDPERVPNSLPHGVGHEQGVERWHRGQAVHQE